MKKLSGIFVAMTLALVFACTEKGPQSGGHEPSGPENQLVPLVWGENLVESGNVGVTITVLSVENDNFEFELMPGTDVGSYLVAVYPLSILYNSLLNDDMKGKTEVDINEKVREYVFSTGDLFKSDGTGYDFYSNQIDWKNSEYSADGPVLMPDADYIIAVVACSDNEGSEDYQEDLTVCRIHTTSSELVGNPGGEIKVVSGYSKFSVQHLPNEDAKYCYFFGSMADGIDEYIDVFGDVMFRDFIRHYQVQPIECSDTDSMYYTYDFASSADSKLRNCTAVVWCDANLTPCPSYNARYFYLEEIPEGADYANAVCSPRSGKTGTTRVWFDVALDKCTQTIYYRLYTEKAANDLIQAGEGSAAQLSEQESLRRYGLGFNNPDFLWDRTNKKPIGDDYNGCIELSSASFAPGTSLKLGYVAKNGFSQLSPLQFTDAIVLPQRDLSRKIETTDEDFKIYITDQKRTSFKLNYEYDHSKYAMVYFQYYTEEYHPEEWTSDWGWSEWAEFIFTPCTTKLGEYCSFNILDMNAVETDESDYGYHTYSTMNPDTEYMFFCCCEDYEGRITDIKYASVTTSSVEPGPDPQVEAVLGEDPSGLASYAVSFTIVKDASLIKTCVVDDYSSLSTYLTGITKSDLNDIANSRFTCDQWKQACYDFCSDYGRESPDDCSELLYKSSTSLAICIATGKDESGDPVYALTVLVCKDGVSNTFEQIFEQ